MIRMIKLIKLLVSLAVILTISTSVIIKPLHASAENMTMPQHSELCEVKTNYGCLALNRLYFDWGVMYVKAMCCEIIDFHSTVCENISIVPCQIEILADYFYYYRVYWLQSCELFPYVPNEAQRAFAFLAAERRERIRIQLIDNEIIEKFNLINPLNHNCLNPQWEFVSTNVVSITTHPLMCGQVIQRRTVMRCRVCGFTAVSYRFDGFYHVWGAVANTCSEVCSLCGATRGACTAWGSTHAPHGFCQQNCNRCGRARSVPCTWSPSGTRCLICNSITARSRELISE